jgi:predicted nucleic acid-binding protein
LIVVDASIAVQWLVPEAGAELSASVLGRADLIAPGLLMVEVANALRRKIMSGDIGKPEADDGFRLIAANVDLRLPSPSLVTRALAMALEMSHPIYDCIYLALAEAIAGRLLTRDREFAARVERIALGHLLATLPLGDHS